MKLCRYFDKNGLDVLKNYRLKVTDPTTFNDPFEFCPAINGVLNKQVFKRFWEQIKNSDNYYSKFSSTYNLKNRNEFKRFFENISVDEAYEKLKEQYPNNFRSIINDTRKKLAKILRVLCFSNFDLIKPQEDILMWGHYTNNHSGLRITFDINRMKLDGRQLVNIDYKKERTQIDLNDIFIDNVEKKLKILLKEKCDLWSYEHEYRLLIYLSECGKAKVDDFTFDCIKISPDTILRVDIGVNAKNDFKKNVLETLGNKDFSHTEVKFAQIDDTEYKLNYIEKWS